MDGDGMMNDLKCPVCLDVFKDPTILNCGHTFCRGCLQSQDQLHINRHGITCPVCRGVTGFGRGRVAGLTANLLVRGLLDDSQTQAHPQQYCEFCPLHSKLYLDIFCVECEELICLSCYATQHKDHVVQKKEEIEGEMMKELKGIIGRGKSRKTQLVNFKDEIEQQSDMIQCHIGHLQVQIRESFAKKVKVLEKHQKKLLKELDHASMLLDGIMKNRCLSELDIDIRKVGSSVASLTGNNAFKCPDTRTFRSNRESFHYLKGLSSDEVISNVHSRMRDEATSCLTDAERCRFLPLDGNNLDLGHLEIPEYLKKCESPSDVLMDLEIDIMN
nr:tripartite motif-containing protein 12A-like [Lytechinus pictus]